MHSRYIVLSLVLILLLTSFVAITADAARPLTPNSLSIALAPQDSTTLTAVADATVKSWQPNSNFGSDATLELSYSKIDVAKEEVSLVKFDLSSLPSGAVIDSATLQLYLDSTAGASPVNIGVYFVTSSWNESTVTWNTFPTAETLGLSGSVDNSAGYKSWNITSYAQSWLDGTANNGVYLRGPTDGTYYGRTFKSREGRIYPPLLAITYHIACASDPYEPNDSLNTAAAATPGSAQQGYICPSNDDDYFEFTASNGQQIQIDLDGAGGANLPADFDLELYDPDQSLAGESNNGGTQTEQIVHTADQSGTWYVHIFGYNGAYSASDPYRLRITL
ncbi:MAG: DNRLRE domain-containing protein, partial [Chloroflexi bacterium]|nr:DNRLRE domain-containing protein [Chloroflexota bacterium]